MAIPCLAFHPPMAARRGSGKGGGGRGSGEAVAAPQGRVTAEAAHVAPAVGVRVDAAAVRWQLAKQHR